MADCVNALREWTGKASATVVFDSTVDEFTADGLFNTIQGKPNIALVGFTAEGDVFGAFYSVAVTEQGEEYFDPDTFAFSFESRGRCMAPQRFVASADAKKQANLSFCHNDGSAVVDFWVSGDGFFWLENERPDLLCFFQMCDAFEGLEDTTLSGKYCPWGQGPFHDCTRLVAIQLS